MSEVLSTIGFILMHIIGCAVVVFCLGSVIAALYSAGERYEEDRKWAALGYLLSALVVGLIGVGVGLWMTTGKAFGQCATSTDTLFSGGCIYVDAEPSILPGETHTHCWVLVSESDNVEPGFVFVQSPGCGAIAYSALDYTIWNEACDSLYASGHLWPFPQVNPTAYLPDMDQNYLVCQTWVAQCEQSAYCLTFYSSPLPVTLLSFDGEATATGILLRWATGSETGSRYFTVWRSVDASRWSQVGLVNAQGWSQYEATYSLLDEFPAQGLQYYMLQQTDMDGSEQRFRTIAVNFNSESNPGFLWFWTLDGKRLR